MGDTAEVTGPIGWSVENEVLLLRWRGNRAYLYERLGLSVPYKKLSEKQKHLKHIAELQNFNLHGDPRPSWGQGALVYVATKPPHAAHIREAVKRLQLSPLNILVSDMYLELLMEVVAPDSTGNSSVREQYVASRSHILPYPASGTPIIFPVSAERDAQEYEAEVRAQMYTEKCSEANLEILQRFPGLTALDVRAPADEESDPRLTHSTGSRPQAFIEQQTGDAADLGPCRKKFTKNKRLRKVRAAKDSAESAGPDSVDDASRSASLTATEAMGTTPSSSLTYRTHPTAFIEHIRHGPDGHGRIYRVLARCPHEMIKYLLDYFKGDAHMAEIGWVTYNASRNKQVEPDQALQNVINSFDRKAGSSASMMHDLVHPGGSAKKVTVLNPNEDRLLLETLVRKMQSYGPLYIPNYLLDLWMDHHEQAKYLENLNRPLPRDIPSCVECVFLGAMCPACKDVLDSVKDSTLVAQKAPHMSAWGAMPCQCEPDADVCMRCGELVCEIRGVRFERSGCGVHDSMPQIDISIRKPECFPAGYHAKMMARYRSAKGRQLHTIRVLEAHARSL